MRNEEQSWGSFFVAGAIFGEVGGWLLLLHALYWTFHGSRLSNMMNVPLQTWAGTVLLSEVRLTLYAVCGEICRHPRNTWNITKYCACHDKWFSWLIFVSCETLFTLRAVAEATLQHHQILPLPGKMTLQNFKEIFRKQLSLTMRGRSEHDPRMKPSVRNPPRKWGYSSRSTRAFSMETYNISCSGYHSKFHQMLHLPPEVTDELHQILPLPQKVTFELHQKMHLSWTVTIELQQIMLLPRKMSFEFHQIVHLPRKVRPELQQMMHVPRKVTLEPLLFFDSTILFSTIPCCSAEVVLDWTSTWLNYYLTKLLFDGAITWHTWLN